MDAHNVGRGHGAFAAYRDRRVTAAAREPVGQAAQAIAETHAASIAQFGDGSVPGECPAAIHVRPSAMANTRAVPEAEA